MPAGGHDIIVSIFSACEICNHSYHGDCSIHGPLEHIKDNHAAKYSGSTPAKSSLPGMLYLGESSIPTAGTGVFAKENIKARICFGPYVGVAHKDKDRESNYQWEVSDVCFFLEKTLRVCLNLRFDGKRSCLLE